MFGHSFAREIDRVEQYQLLLSLAYKNLIESLLGLDLYLNLIFNFKY